MLALAHGAECRPAGQLTACLGPCVLQATESASLRPLSVLAGSARLALALPGALYDESPGHRIVMSN